MSARSLAQIPTVEFCHLPDFVRSVCLNNAKHKEIYWVTCLLVTICVKPLYLWEACLTNMPTLWIFWYWYQGTPHTREGFGTKCNQIKFLKPNCQAWSCWLTPFINIPLMYVSYLGIIFLKKKLSITQLVDNCTNSTIAFQCIKSSLPVFRSLLSFSFSFKLIYLGPFIFTIVKF